ncbi:GNAT family N-acetyltransferase [Cellulomonas fimi]|uniref:GNAT family N-acetyltransferase n=1 Tax=Cellulomonas fimi TaxID=1708 RepID=UPI00234DF68F|nr:GNAT family protein [Cellulomonas fimi]MDC7123213.1 GNAT family N-acetyltransferase [Cellulomonas fimi]
MPLLAAPVVLPGRWGVRPQPSLTADGLLLRPWTPADVPTVRAAYDDPAIRWWHARSMSDDDEALAWVDAKNAAWRDERAVEWAVVVAPTRAANSDRPGAPAHLPEPAPAPALAPSSAAVPAPPRVLAPAGAPVLALAGVGAHVRPSSVPGDASGGTPVAPTSGPVPHAAPSSGPVPRAVPPRHLAGPPLRRLDAPPAGTVVGRVALTNLDLYEGVGALTYWVVPAARGHRVAVRAGAEALRWAFEELGLHRVEVEHSTRNDASCRVADLLGCRAEGVRRGHALHADGHHDMHLHARLRTDHPDRPTRPAPQAGPPQTEHP